MNDDVDQRYVCCEAITTLQQQQRLSNNAYSYAPTAETVKEQLTSCRTPQGTGDKRVSSEVPWARPRCRLRTVGHTRPRGRR